MPGLNHVLAYGQSLSTGWEGWPALSRTAVPDTLMIGESVRPASESAPVWEPVGGAALRPLVGTVQDLAGNLLTDAAIASLPDGALALGETVLEGALAEWHSLGAESPGARFVASACGVGGRTLEALSKGASPELFNRLRSCVRLARGIAADAGEQYRVLALLFLQGEHNSFGIGGTSDGARYKALLTRFHADFLADIAAVTAGQTVPPAMFLYQTGGAYASADNAVAQAQLDFALQADLCFLAAPVYPVTDKGGHLDANGYRWLGAQFGKVMHRVLTQGQRWRPLHPLRAVWREAAVRVELHVPVPPLAWGLPFAGQERRDVVARGFSVHDGDGGIAIAAAALDGADGVILHLAREPGAGAVLRYASAEAGGLGCLHDSDLARSTLRFSAAGGAARAPSRDLAALAGRPYPLQNWCVAFAIAIEMPEGG